MSKPTYYKVLGPNGKPFHGGNGVWHLPKGKRPGKWMPEIKNVLPCQSGYHLCRLRDLVEWLGPEVWVAEGRGKRVAEDNKVVFAQARYFRS